MRKIRLTVIDKKRYPELQQQYCAESVGAEGEYINLHYHLHWMLGL